MFWPFLAASAVGISFVKLGALSVTVQVLSMALQFLIVAILIGVVVVLWKRFKQD